MSKFQKASLQAASVEKDLWTSIVLTVQLDLTSSSICQNSSL